MEVLRRQLIYIVIAKNVIFLFYPSELIPSFLVVKYSHGVRIPWELEDSPLDRDYLVYRGR